MIKLLMQWLKAIPKGKEAQKFVSELPLYTTYYVNEEIPDLSLFILRSFLERRGRTGSYTYYLRGYPIAGSTYSLKGILAEMPSKSVSFIKLVDYISPSLFLNLGYLERNVWGALILREE